LKNLLSIFVKVTHNQIGYHCPQPDAFFKNSSSSGVLALPSTLFLVGYLPNFSIGVIWSSANFTLNLKVPANGLPAASVSYTNFSNSALHYRPQFISSACINGIKIHVFSQYKY